MITTLVFSLIGIFCLLLSGVMLFCAGALDAEHAPADAVQALGLGLVCFILGCGLLIVV